MRLSNIFILFLLTLLVFTKLIVAQEKKGAFDNHEKKTAFPIPEEPNQLFYLQRDPNTNTVIYTINLEDGEIDESNPVKAHWIRYAEEGQRSNLSFIQRKMAYGVHHKKIDENEFTIYIQAYKKLMINIKYNKQKEKFQAFTKIKDKDIVLEKIFVRIIGGSLFHPNVEYIEITGHDPDNKSKIKHRFSP